MARTTPDRSDWGLENDAPSMARRVPCRASREGAVPTKMTSMLSRLAGVVIAYPRRILWVATACCLLLASVALTVPTDMSFLSVLSQDDPLVERYLAGRPTGRGVDSSLHGERRHRGVRLEPCDCLLGVPLGALVFDGQRSTVLRGRGADVPGFGSVIGADLPGLGDVGALVLLEPDRSVTREAGGSAEVGAIQLAAGERVLVDGSRWAALEPVPRFERADGPGRCSFCRGRTAAGSRVRICEEGHRSCADGCGEEGCPWCAGPAEGVA